MGFYSSFIVADRVEVISKKEGEKAYLWASEGLGEFEIAETDEGIERGTRVILHLKKDHENFTD